MGNINLSGIGPELKIQQGTVPQDVSAGTRTSAAIDRRGFNSCVLEAQTGATSGAPTAQTLDAKLQHCDTSGGTYADYVPGAAGSGAVAQITAASTRKKKSIDLRAAKQFIKVVEVVALTAGTSPKMGAATTVILGGADVLAPQADD